MQTTNGNGFSFLNRIYCLKAKCKWYQTINWFCICKLYLIVFYLCLSLVFNYMYFNNAYVKWYLFLCDIHIYLYFHRTQIRNMHSIVHYTNINNQTNFLLILQHFASSGIFRTFQSLRINLFTEPGHIF